MTTANVPPHDIAALHALAVRLLDDTGTGQSQLHVRSVSAQLPLEVTVPDGSTVLGSLERETGDVAIL